MITLTCNFCGEKYKVFSCKKDKRKHCSRKCYSESRRGRPLSAENRRKISEAMRGKTLSEEHKRKISMAKKGRQLTGEHKRKLGLALKGHPVSEETKKKISASHKKLAATPEGKERFKKLGEKTRERFKKGIHPFLDSKVRARALKAIIETNHRKLKDGTHPFQNPEVRIKTRIALGKKSNSGSRIEEKIGRLLDEMGIDHEPQKRISNGFSVLERKKYLFPDFFLPKNNLLIECDGEFWHQDEEKEKCRDSVFFEQGYRVLHLTGKEICNDLVGCRTKIENLIM